MTEATTVDEQTTTIAYHPGKQTVIEIWSEDGATIAELPSGERVYDEQALEVLNAVVNDEKTLVREVEPRTFDGVFA